MIARAARPAWAASGSWWDQVESAAEAGPPAEAPMVLAEILRSPDGRLLVMADAAEIDTVDDRYELLALLAEAISIVSSDSGACARLAPTDRVQFGWARRKNGARGCARIGDPQAPKGIVLPDGDGDPRTCAPDGKSTETPR